MAEQHERIFYELMWRIQARGRQLPLPWWVQQYFRRWVEDYDQGLFPSKEAAFSSNAHYRYWNMIGVKDHHQECLVGQAGEVEPVYDQYSVSFFLFDPGNRRLFFPQFPESGGLTQQWEQNYLPVHITRYEAPLGFTVDQKLIATTVGPNQKSLVLGRFVVRAKASGQAPFWLCLSVSPAGPTGFRRHDRARTFVENRWITYLRYSASDMSLAINTSLGPTFDKLPQHFGLYGNGTSADPDFYLTFNPYQDLLSSGALNGWDTATDFFGGYCQGVFAWEVNLPSAADSFSLDIRLPVDDFRGASDLQMLRQAPADGLEQNNRNFWTSKLDGSGLQATLPPLVAHLFDLFRICRSTLLILADDGEIHPGPTIYDSFWIRDSSVEGVACALAGDLNLPERQFGEHYTRADVFHQEQGRVGPVSIYGFFGGEHEQQDEEWDSNGEALWAFGRFDRIRGAGAGFGARVFSPYVVEGARWLRDNRTLYGLLPSGWSAEHLGDKSKPHYWDDFWAVAGCWEAAQLAQRLGAPQTAELWAIYDDLRRATGDSIRWALDQQRQRGFWETFIPTGPADVGALNSTMVGTVAYFHPCRLYMGAKLGQDVDGAARITLETIWSHFVDGGLRHDAAWHCYGPYLTLQLAHAFLLLGDVNRMDQCLSWSVNNAAFAKIHPDGLTFAWQAVLGAWNEQHCYPIAKEFGEFPPSWWYMGDIPHGWAAAEFILLLRDILFFEADEDRDPHIYLAPGVPPHWLSGGWRVNVRDAPTIFGTPFAYELRHDEAARTVTIDIGQPAPAGVRYVYPCRLGSGVVSARADGQDVAISGREAALPAGTRHAEVVYA